MRNSAEVAQLAHILRISAEVVRDLAGLRPLDAARLGKLAVQTDAIAVELASIAEPYGSPRQQ